jgi:hypothetical protein
MKTSEFRATNELFAGYGKDQPLPQSASLLLVNLALLLQMIRLARHRRYPIPNISELLLLGIGTHKLSRLIAKDRVTAPARAPLTQFEKSSHLLPYQKFVLHYYSLPRFSA